MRKFHKGDRVEDVTSHRCGTIIYVYEESGIRDELVAVIWDDHLDKPPLAYHVDDVRRLRRGA